MNLSCILDKTEESLEADCLKIKALNLSDSCVPIAWFVIQVTRTTILNAEASRLIKMQIRRNAFLMEGDFHSFAWSEWSQFLAHVWNAKRKWIIIA